MQENELYGIQMFVTHRYSLIQVTVSGPYHSSRSGYYPQTSFSLSCAVHQLADIFGLL
jgi:hypothetical protein